MDANVWRGDTQLGSITDFASHKVSTKVLLTDVQLDLIEYALGFAKTGFDAKKRQLRPDILNVTAGKIFEIKPWRAGSDGIAQLWAYQAFLNSALMSFDGAPTYSPGWWRIPVDVFSVSDEDTRFAFVFMFPGFEKMPAIPGVIWYLLFDVDPQQEVDVVLLASYFVILIGAALSGRNISPSGKHPSDSADTKEPHDSWQPNGDYPGDDVPYTDGEDAEPPEWEDPNSIPAQNDASSSDQAGPISFLVQHWFLLLMIILVALLVLLLLPETIGAIGAAMAAFGVVAAAVVGAAAIVISFTSGSELNATASTTQMLEILGTTMWAQFLVNVSSLSGLPTTILESFAAQ